MIGLAGLDKVSIAAAVLVVFAVHAKSPEILVGNPVPRSA